MITPQAEQVVIQTIPFLISLSNERYDWNGTVKSDKLLIDYVNDQFEQIAVLSAAFILARQSVIDFLEAMLSKDVKDFRRVFVDDETTLKQLRHIIFEFPSQVTKEVAPPHLSYLWLLTEFLFLSDKISQKLNKSSPGLTAGIHREAEKMTREMGTAWFDVDGVPIDERSNDFLLFVLGFSQHGHDMELTA
jgi:hypothetical protein